MWVAWWRNVVCVGLAIKRWRFNSWSGSDYVTTVGKLLTTFCLCHQWAVTLCGWEGNRRPCATGFSGQTIQGLWKWDGQPAYAPMQYGTLYLYSLGGAVKILHLFTRGIHKVRGLTQLVARYAHHILSLFNIVSCSWNALGTAFLKSSDSPAEELLILPFQPSICLAICVFMNSVPFYASMM